MASKKKKSREMADGIMESVRELQGYLDRGMTGDEIVADIRKRHPERVRIVFVPPAPREYPPGTVKKLRESLGMSQATFAATIGVSCILVQGWEQGVREPSMLARRLLDTISADPTAWLASLGRSRRAG